MNEAAQYEKLFDEAMTGNPDPAKVVPALVNIIRLAAADLKEASEELGALHLDYDDLYARYQGARASLDRQAALLTRYQWQAIDGDPARVPKGRTLDLYSSERGVRFTGEWRPEYLADVTHWAYRQPAPAKQEGGIK